nr:hypothetical protein Itr_chr02CG12260 [Ipomoea trifida]
MDAASVAATSWGLRLSPPPEGVNGELIAASHTVAAAALLKEESDTGVPWLLHGGRRGEGYTPVAAAHTGGQGRKLADHACR